MMLLGMFGVCVCSYAGGRGEVGFGLLVFCVGGGGGGSGGGGGG